MVPSEPIHIHLPHPVSLDILVNLPVLVCKMVMLTGCLSSGCCENLICMYICYDVSVTHKGSCVGSWSQCDNVERQWDL